MGEDDHSLHVDEADADEKRDGSTPRLQCYDDVGDVSP